MVRPGSSPTRQGMKDLGLLRRPAGRGVPASGGTADEGAWRAAAALPEHQFGPQKLHLRRQAGCRDALEQPVAGSFAEHAYWLVDGGQRWLAQSGGKDVVEPGHGDLFRDPDAGRGERSQHSDGHLVVGGNYSVRELAPAFGEDPPAGRQPAFDIVRAVGGAGQPDGWVVAQHLEQPAPPLGRIRHAGRAVDMVDPALAVVFDQVREDGGRSGPVVGGHHVNLPCPDSGETPGQRW
jgi:hypothetical protein